MKSGYELLDSGDGVKWERFGKYILERPSPQAIWRANRNVSPDATFTRENRWQANMPNSWEMEWKGITFLLKLTEFGHVGCFPEHVALWETFIPLIREGDRVLNLFAYSGGATLMAAKRGAKVCHVDASKGMVDWARENARRNGLEKAPIRWIVDDVMKFLKREIKRDSLYEGIILDPPSFGRGSQGEVFKIEEEISQLLELSEKLLSKERRFLILSCHTPGFTPIVLHHLAESCFKKTAEVGEMLLESARAYSIPSGSFARVLYA